MLFRLDTNSTRNLLDRNELLEIEYKPATRGQRFANYLIDLVGFAFVLVALFFVVGLGQAILGINQDETAVESSDGLVENLIFYGFYALYYTLSEAALGKTLGKMVTKTRVINEAGQPITLGQAFGRAMCRFIPFDALTFLVNSGGRGLHDRIPKTWVVQDLPVSPLALQPTNPDPETE